MVFDVVVGEVELVECEIDSFGKCDLKCDICLFTIMFLMLLLLFLDVCN